MSHVALFLPHLDVSGGLGVHCRMLLAALNQVPSQLRFTVYAPADPQRLFPTTAREAFDFVSLDPNRFTLHSLAVPVGTNLAQPLDVLLAGPLAESKPDLLYCSYYTGMQSPPCSQIVAFHDAGFLDNPEGFGATAAIRKATLDAIRPAIRLIQCISGDARDRICQRLPWDVVKTAVVWHALSDELDVNPQATPPAFAKPYFFLPVGAATGFNRVRKNVPTAVRAFRKLPATGASLIIAGTAALTTTVLSELLPPEECGSVIDGSWHADDGTIRILPTLSRPEFLTAMRHACAVVYPSRYEGFGLPTIEAMALGVPLIAAKATSIPEIVGDAGMLIDPDDLAGFTGAMLAALTDPQRMQRYVDAGRKRARLFSLERLGHEMTALFERECHAAE
ncbi:N/A [soil metagenome]